MHEHHAQTPEHKFMNSIVTDKERAETHLTHLASGDRDYIDSWTKNPMYRKVIQMADSASTDETSQIAEVINTMLAGYAQPGTFGRELCTTSFTSQEEVKVPLFTRGKAVQSGKRGQWSIHSSSVDTEFLKVPVGDILQHKATLDETAREDYTPQQIMMINQNAIDAMAVAETEIILKKFETERANGIRITKGSSNGEVPSASMSLLIKLHGRLARKDRRVDCYVMSPATKEALLLDSNLQRSDYFEGVQRAYDEDEGFMGRFLGGMILSSSLVPDDVIYAINKAAMVYVIRTDMMVNPFFDEATRTSGITCRLRYGLAAGRISECLATWY